MTTRPFIHDDFLLQSAQARALYHDYARDLPIIDYHCHLPPAEIAADQRYANMSEIWLGGDHYKWRAMRSNGVAERYCTGDAPAREKFDQWAATMPHLLRNPLYHWTHLELARYFGITDLLSPETADAIWEAGNARLADPDFSARGLMTRSKVVVVCTTDDPIDTLEHHQAIAADPSFDVQVLPTWRPDKGMAVEAAAPFNAWVTGQRRDQSPGTRSDVPVVQLDRTFGTPERPLVKFNPLSFWTSKQVWAYIRDHDVPYNALHDRGFISIGCEPCTRPTNPGQHEREGRWWWEEETKKECGLHLTPR